MRIAVFDSGHGGLDILRLLESLPLKKELYYFADMAFMPYGNKEEPLIRRRCLAMADELIEQEIQGIIIACNTATAAAIESLRKEFDLPFIGVEPYVSYINQVSPKERKEKRVGAFVTPLTFQSPRFIELLKRRDPQGLISVHPVARLAEIIEDFIFQRDRNLFERELHTLLSPFKKFSWRELILGCTHYPLVGTFISEYLDVKLISPGPSIIQQFCSVFNFDFKEEIQPSSHFEFFYHNTRIHKKAQWERRRIGDFLFWE